MPLAISPYGPHYRLAEPIDALVDGLLQTWPLIQYIRTPRPFGERSLYCGGGTFRQINVAHPQSLLQSPEGPKVDTVEILGPAELQSKILDPLASEVVRC